MECHLLALYYHSNCYSDKCMHDHSIVMPISLMVMQLSSNTSILPSLLVLNGSTLKSNNSYVSGVQHTSMKAHGLNVAYTCNHINMMVTFLAGHYSVPPLLHPCMWSSHAVLHEYPYRLNPDDVYIPATRSLYDARCIIVPMQLMPSVWYHTAWVYGYSMDTKSRSR